jgi:hypothetical protein
MRSILLSGDHPMLERARMSAAPADTADNDAMMAPPARSAPAMPGSTVVAVDRTVRGPRGMGNGVRFAGAGAPQGLAQIIGLALGSPEFQRR